MTKVLLYGIVISELTPYQKLLEIQQPEIWTVNFETQDIVVTQILLRYNSLVEAFPAERLAASVIPV